MKRLKTIAVNWILLFTVPIWIIPVAIYYCVNGNTELMDLLTGQERIDVA